jgi:hypothetical protein
MPSDSSKNSEERQTCQVVTLGRGIIHHGVWEHPLLWDDSRLLQLSSRDRWNRATEHLPCCPSARGSPGCHRRCPLPIPLCSQLAFALQWLTHRHAQRGMGAHEVIIGLPPVQMSLHVGSLPGGSPGAPSESGYAMTDCQIYALDKRRVDASGEAQPLQCLPEGWPCSQPDDVLDPHQVVYNSVTSSVERGSHIVAELKYSDRVELVWRG